VTRPPGAELGVSSRASVVVAHLVTTGLGPVYDGVSHLIVSPDDVVTVFALALLAGLNGPAAARHGIFAATAGWSPAASAAFSSGIALAPASAAAASFLALGTLVAADRRLAPPVVGVLAASVAVWHGWLNGASIAASGVDALALAGIVAAAFVVMTLTAAFASARRDGWMRIAVRVAGSRVAAIGLLMLGWSLRRPPV
jgi:hydrogenase/urease accessory protein HupE